MSDNVETQEQIVTSAKTFSYYLSKLNEKRSRELESDLFDICLSYYGNGNWKLVRNRISNKFRLGTHKIISKYIQIIDEEIIEAISQDLLISKGIKN